ncbi:MAG TPA: hypothetical protein VFH80_12135 [Solirubrobacteraceae bacterium]|nr:hypothetical protein [Solirubrobacteraceae bacterium]
MTRRSPASTTRIAGLAFVVLIALAMAATSALRAQAKPRAAGGARKAFSVNIVNHNFGSEGAKGSFSAKLGPAAHVVAALMSAVTGVPYTQIAKGGTFIAKDVPSGKGRLAVVKFADHALGTACVQWSGTSGPYDPSKGYLVATGSMKIIGGTGAAAHWKGNLTFKQTGVSGTDTLVFSALAAGSTGPAHGLTPACKAVTRLKP